VVAMLYDLCRFERHASQHKSFSKGPPRESAVVTQILRVTEIDFIVICYEY